MAVSRRLRLKRMASFQVGRVTFCGTALAAAILGIGAGILGVIAATTGGGTVVLAGFLLTGGQVGILAGIAGSYAALLGWISRYVC